MRSIFVTGHSSVTDFQHIGVIPMSGSGELLKAVLSESKFRHRVIVIANIVVRAPQVATNGGPPLPAPLHSVLAKRIQHRSTGLPQCLSHFLVCSDLITHSVITAQVV